VEGQGSFFTDDALVALFARARELGLLEIPGDLDSDPWLTTEQAADYLKCSKGQVLNLVSEGRQRVAQILAG
jgi:hypothetical protein